MPALVRGTHKVISKGVTSGKQTTDSLSVVPSLAMSPASGPTGTTVRLTIRGFAKGEVITVKWYNTATSTRTLLSGQVATSLGSKTVTFAVPTGTVGSHKVEAVGSKGTKASANFSLRAGSASVAEEAPAGTPTAAASTTPEPTVTPSSEATDEPRPTRTPRVTETPESGPTPAPSEIPATPDLVVAEVELQPGAEATARDRLTVSVEVGNAGDGGTERSFVVCAYVDRAQAPESGDDPDARARVRRNLSAGETIGVDVGLGRLDAGSHTIWISIDCGNGVDESDETNNLAGPFEVTIVSASRQD
jgi:hypothetical protein